MVFGYDYAWLGLRRTAQGIRLVQMTCLEANNKGQEREIAGLALPAGTGGPGKPLFLRVTVAEGAKCRFAYSLDGTTFQPIGDEFTAKVSRWVGAKVGVGVGMGAADGVASTVPVEPPWVAIRLPSRSEGPT